MSKPTLSERVAILERQVAQLMADRHDRARPKTWQDTYGMFAGDEVMREIFDEALKIRERSRKRARR
jgi:hypothetical protein